MIFYPVFRGSALQVFKLYGIKPGLLDNSLTTLKSTQIKKHSLKWNWNPVKIHLLLNSLSLFGNIAKVVEIVMDLTRGDWIWLGLLF